MAQQKNHIGDTNKMVEHHIVYTNKMITAVEWFVKQIQTRLINDGEVNYVELSNEAKEMEKEQMHKCASFWRGKENEIEKPMFDEYYNQTYTNGL
jgi:hypothetical protein